MPKNRTPALRPLLTLAGLLVGLAGPAHADLVVGVSLPLTGPASGLGVPMHNGLKRWPATLAGERVRLIVLDDATDPAKGVQNARRLTSEEHVDLLVGSGATPVAAAMAEVAAEQQTVQLALSPVPLPAGKDTWTFRLPHSTGVMSDALVAHMQRQGVKTLGFIGYADAYGEAYLQEMTPRLAAAGIQLTTVERFARTDTQVSAQVLKLVAARPDAVLVVASGSGAAMPQSTLAERGYAGRVYQSAAAATRDLMRVGGKAVEGGYVVAGPVIVAEQLPSTHPAREPALRFVQDYERAHGAGSRNQLAAHGYDIATLLEQVLPIALKSARPGNAAFRVALRDALEKAPAVPVSNGVLDYSAQNHWGYPPDTGVVLKIVRGDWQLER